MNIDKNIQKTLIKNLLDIFLEERNIDTNKTYVYINCNQSKLVSYQFESIDDNYLNLTLLESRDLKNDLMNRLSKCINEICSDNDVEVRTVFINNESTLLIEIHD